MSAAFPTPPMSLPVPPLRLPLWQRLMAPVVSPPVFDFWARRLHPTWTWSRVLARVVARKVETRDMVSLVLQPNRHFAGFEPGQHLAVTVEIEGVRLTRSYSPTRVPARDRRIHLTIQRIAGGRVSTHLCDHTQVGDVLELGAAFGALRLPAQAQEPLLLLAAGSGITPLMSLLHAQAARGFPVPVTLLYWARTREEHAFTHELRELAARNPGFGLRFVLTRQAPLLPDEAQGRIDAASLQAWVPELSQCRVYACGPAGFVDTVQALTRGRVHDLQVEAFTLPAADEDAQGSVRVELRASGRTLELPRNQSLLVALESQGLRPKHGCRMGICNSCACGKLSGTTQNLQSRDVQAEPEQALRLCVSAARSDLVLDL